MNALMTHPEPDGNGTPMVRLIGTVSVPVLVTPWGVVARITPYIAKALLAQNTKNRALRPTRVRLYERDMSRWFLNGETITFTSDGTLLDGQHRLEACVASGETFETYIIGDLDEAVRDSVNSGLSRTYADILGFDGEPDGRTLASVLMACWRLEYNGTLATGAGYPNPTRTDLNEYLHRNPGVLFSLSVARRASKALDFPKSIAGGLHYLMSCLSPEQADLFWDEVISGVGLVPGTGPHALRAAQIRQMRRPRRAEVIDVAAWTVKAWNAYRSHGVIRNLRWRRGGKSPESFPKVR